MRTYEYRCVHAPAARTPNDLVKAPDLAEVNALGAEGWEAFAAVPAAMDGYAYLVTDGLHVLLRRSVVNPT